MISPIFVSALVSAVFAFPQQQDPVPVPAILGNSTGFLGDIFNTTGAAFCWRPTSSRKVTFTSVCEAGLELNADQCYTPCPEGMTGKGPACMNANGWTVGKLRGIHGKVCSPGLEQFLGLCYDSCPASFNAEGPSCWDQCHGDFPVSCGAGCAKSSKACQAETISQVTNIADVAFNIGSLIFNLAGEPEKMVGKEVGDYVRKAGEHVIKDALVHVLLHRLGGDAAAKVADIVINNLFGGDSTPDWTELDPTGVSALVEAFYKPLCADL